MSKRSKILNQRSNYPSAPREAAEDAVRVPSERTVRARASISQQPPAQAPAPAPAPAPSQTPRQSAEERVWAFFMESRGSTRRECETALGLTKSEVAKTVDSLKARGLLEETGVRYPPKGTRGGNRPSAELTARGLYTPAQTPEAKAHAEDPLAAMLAKDVSIPEESLEAYQRAFAEIGAMRYGIREIDAVLGALTDVLRQRCAGVRRRCPMCGGVLRVDVAKVSCARCGVEVSTPSLERSLRALAAMKGVE